MLFHLIGYRATQDLPEAEDDEMAELYRENDNLKSGYRI